jgi:hypothetical protein
MRKPTSIAKDGDWVRIYELHHHRSALLPRNARARRPKFLVVDQSPPGRRLDQFARVITLRRRRGGHRTAVQRPLTGAPYGVPCARNVAGQEGRRKVPKRGGL